MTPLPVAMAKYETMARPRTVPDSLHVSIFAITIAITIANASGRLKASTNTKEKTYKWNKRARFSTRNETKKIPKSPIVKRANTTHRADMPLLWALMKMYSSSGGYISVSFAYHLRKGSTYNRSSRSGEMPMVAVVAGMGAPGGVDRDGLGRVRVELGYKVHYAM